MAGRVASGDAPAGPDDAGPLPGAAARTRRGWLRLAGWLAALGVIGATLAAWRQPGLVLDLFGQIYSCM